MDLQCSFEFFFDTRIFTLEESLESLRSESLEKEGVALVFPRFGDSQESLQSLDLQSR